MRRHGGRVDQWRRSLLSFSWVYHHRTPANSRRPGEGSGGRNTWSSAGRRSTGTRDAKHTSTFVFSLPSDLGRTTLHWTVSTAVKYRGHAESRKSSAPAPIRTQKSSIPSSQKSQSLRFSLVRSVPLVSLSPVAPPGTRKQRNIAESESRPDLPHSTCASRLSEVLPPLFLLPFWAVGRPLAPAHGVVAGDGVLVPAAARRRRLVLGPSAIQEQRRHRIHEHGQHYA